MSSTVDVMMTLSMFMLVSSHIMDIVEMQLSALVYAVSTDLMIGTVTEVT